MSNCQSCGMPMMKPEDYGGGKLDNSYCKHCTDELGSLLPHDTVREKMIQFHIQNLSKTRDQAENDVDRHMALMPAWKMAVGIPVQKPDTVSKIPVGADKPKPLSPVPDKPTAGLGTAAPGGTPVQPPKPPVQSSPPFSRPSVSFPPKPPVQSTAEPSIPRPISPVPGPKPLEQKPTMSPVAPGLKPVSPSGPATPPAGGAPQNLGGPASRPGGGSGKPTV